MRTPAAALVPCLLIVACTRGGDPGESARSGPGHATAVPGRVAAPLEFATTGHFARREIVESSGAAMSATQPGVFFTINDSGNEPRLYASDSAGTDRGAWRVSGARNGDWESVSVGPCAGGPAPRCVYVGDTGDNDAHRDTRTIYRVPEPDVSGAAGATGVTAAAEVLRYRYADGPRDVEAMYVGPDGSVTLVSKRPLRTAFGHRRPALVFTLPARAWGAAGTAVATLVDSLPAIVPGTGAGGNLVTDAALSPDGRHVAVRTYSRVFVYAADPATGRPRGVPAVCDVDPLAEPGGEGVTWFDAGRLLLTSEDGGSALHVVRCPMPDAAR